jgi:cellobiose-specific phosphotransferase system component IIB
VNEEMFREDIKYIKECLQKITEKINKIDVIETNLMHGEKRFENIENDLKNIEGNCMKTGCMNPTLANIFEHLKRYSGNLEVISNKMFERVNGKNVLDYMVELANNYHDEIKLKKEIRNDGIKKLFSIILKILSVIFISGILFWFAKIGIDTTQAINNLKP